MSRSSEQAFRSPLEGELKLNIPQTNVNRDIKDLNTKRSSIKGRITKYKNFISTLIESEAITRANYYTINQRFERLRELFTQFEDVQSEIESLNQNNLDSELDIRETIESDFCTLIAQTQCFLEKHENKFKLNKSESGDSNSECRNSCNQTQNAMSFKLPTIKIANFDGTYYKWLEFRDTFSALIHNNDRIEPIHKFYYLNSYLEGEASRVISNLEVSSANYKEAWGLLCERYNNVKQLISNHLHSLVNISPVQRDSAKGLRFLIDHVSKNLRALNTLGEKTESWDSLVIHLVAAKLDSFTSIKWEEHKNSLSEIPSLNDFFQFLKGRSDVLESIRQNKPDRHSYNHKGEPHPPSFHKSEKSHTKSYAISASPAPSSSATCVLCHGRHRLYDCASFREKPVDERIAEVLRLKLCFNCLRKGHSPRQCRLGPCSSCKERHNSLLHKERSQAVSTAKTHSLIAQAEDEVERDHDSNDVINMSVLSNTNVLLSTALVEVYNSNTNQCITIRALLDSGSQTSLITTKVKNELNLTPQPTRVDIVGVGNQTLSNSLQSCTLRLRSKQNNFEIDVQCLVLPQISNNLPNKTFDASFIKLPNYIKLADSSFNQCAPVDMLIGADLFWHLIEFDKVVLGPNQPTALKTKLGWILTGPFVSKPHHRTNTIKCHHLSFNLDNNPLSNESLNNELTNFWALEQIPLRNKQLTAEEIECEIHFTKHTYRDKDGRFHVRLPLLTEPDCLGNSFNLAKRQFLSLEKRFARDPNLKTMYSQFIQQYAQLGHLSESSKLIPEQSYFIPHHAVLRPSSESTKLRVVFNGSAKTTSGYSLNDLQNAGPHIQDSLFNILLRFRQYTYVLSGDVEKMYRMIRIQEKDRNLQMILWRENSTTPIKSLRLNTVTYGLTSSSFLSTRCLWQLGEECNDKNIKTIIQNDFVVDDLLTGSDSKDELLYIKRSVEEALAAGCFNLRKYRSNLSSILVDHNNVQKNLLISSSSHTLGVGWDPNDDLIHFPTNYETKPKITKRSILSESCRVFDPLGLLSLFTIKPKILIQKLWIEKIDWDDPVPFEIRQSWLSFIENMKYLSLLQIPRHVLCKKPNLIEIHCFCDASQKAYAACVYIRSANKQGDLTVRLLCAKAKVATVKPITIPRLELCACLLGAHLANAVEHALRCVITRKVYWTDSSIALAWLGMRYDKLKPFVANRVATILELTKYSEWRHVPTHLNPSDLASRGVDVIKNNNLEMWWSGPSFLVQRESQWPSFNSSQISVNELPEIKKCVNIISTTENETNQQSVINFNRYSKLKFLQRAFAYLLRFINNCKHINNRLTGVLQPEELALSFKKLAYLSQAESFSKEIKILRSKGVLNSKNPLISLHPFLDNENILRVGGRLTYSCYSFEKRHQILLHAKHTFTKLLFQQEHVRLLHAGPQLLLYTIRESIWPIAGRDLARTTARQCIKCRKACGKTQNPIMGSLPEQRVNPGYPFASVAIDLAGPFFITDRKGRGCKITKCYLCLFVCLKYKCAHLEAVSELSTEAFILALRRFISRRGKPIEFFCDNGRNFVGAAKEVGNILTYSADDVKMFSSGEGIKFNFQPAYSPHFGGLVESCVKSAKHHLKRVLGQTHLTFEELATLFSQIEAILNSRPICPLSSSPDDLQPLTPGHFLIGRPLMSLPTRDPQTNVKPTDRFRRLESLRQSFWKRWQLEYITNLQQRNKWRVPNAPMNIGDLVLMKEENAPPMQWKLGRITCLFPGKDGVARVAEVKTTTGTYRRGVSYLCPLLEPAPDSHLKAAASKAPEDVAAHH